MATLSREVIRKLNEVVRPFCASIYLPTHQTGDPAVQQANARALKQQLKILREKLEKEGMSPSAIESYTLPLENLVRESGFWRKRTEGIAVFLSDQRMDDYPLPFPPEPRLFLANHFYLQPLLSCFSDDGQYFVLNLALENIRFFKGSKYSFSEEDIAAWVPGSIETVVGDDYRPRNTQVRSFPGMQQGASYHGYGEGKDDRKTEIMRYIREVEKGISKKLNGEDAPLVLTGTDYLVQTYRNFNAYLGLYPESLAGNQQHIGLEELHQKTWALVSPHFTAPRLRHRARFQQFQDTPQTSSDIAEVLPAALYGKVEALFIRKNTDIWGIYDPARAAVEINPGPGRANTSLTGLAAIQTFLQGGQVYLSSPEEMPFEEAVVCALYRY
ncbi:MAG: hypothetical protein ACOYOO_14340 [Saprospiraceae bacterium]